MRRILIISSSLFFAAGLLGVAMFQHQVGLSGIEIVYPLPPSSIESLGQVELESPEQELKTERSKIVSGMEASF